MLGESGDLFRIPFFDFADGPGPGGTVGNSEHPAFALAVVGEVAVKDLLVDDRRRAGLAGDHEFIGMAEETVVGVGVAVHGKVRAWDHFEGRSLRGEVVEVVEDAGQNRRTRLQAEDLRAVRLSIGVDSDAGVTGLGDGQAARSADQIVAKKTREEFDGDGIADGFNRRRRVGPLDVTAAPLVRAVIDAAGRQAVELGPYRLYVVRSECVGNDDETIQFNGADLLGLAESRPVGRVAAGVGYAVLSVCERGVHSSSVFSYVFLCEYAESSILDCD